MIPQSRLPTNASALAVLSLGAMLAVAAGPLKPVDVKATRPRRGDIIRYVTLPGTIRANQQATLYAKVAGYLKSLSVDRGDRVDAAQWLGEIEVPELVADLGKHKAEVKVAEVDFERITTALKRAPDLIIRQSVDEARGRLDVAKADLERTQTLLGYARITAPFSGIVTARFVDPGAFIPSATSGSAAQTAAILTLADFNTVRAQVPVPEAEAARAQVGQPVRFTVEGLPGVFFEAVISRISYALDEATRTMLIEADVPNPKLLLRPGMYATVKLGLEKHTDALLVPVEAVVFGKGEAATYTVTDSRARKIPVRTGFNDGASVEILEGIAPTQTVILLGKTTLTNEEPVSVTEVK